MFGGFIFRFWFEAETPPPIEACFVGLSGNLGSAIETPLPRFRAEPMAASRASVVSGGECRSGGQPTRRARQPGGGREQNAGRSGAAESALKSHRRPP